MEFSTIFEQVRSSPATRGIAAGAVAYGLMWAYARSHSLSPRGRSVLGLAAGVLAALGGALCVRQVAANFVALRDWDFLCFWTYGRALALGQSPYDIAVLREIAAPRAT